MRQCTWKLVSFGAFHIDSPLQSPYYVIVQQGLGKPSSKCEMSARLVDKLVCAQAVRTIASYNWPR